MCSSVLARAVRDASLLVLQVASQHGHPCASRRVSDSGSGPPGAVALGSDMTSALSTLALTVPSLQGLDSRLRDLGARLEQGADTQAGVLRLMQVLYTWTWD